MDAQYVILAHNHTSDIALPSPEDRAATRYLRDALKMVDVELLDHIVVAGDDFVSLRDDGFFDM
jgi:DNA repair protein RadC